MRRVSQQEASDLIFHKQDEARERKPDSIAEPNRRRISQQTISDPEAGAGLKHEEGDQAKSCALRVRQVFTTCGRNASVAKLLAARPKYSVPSMSQAALDRQLSYPLTGCVHFRA